MAKREIVVLQNEEAWNSYLLEVFEDTPSTPKICQTAQEASPLIQRGKLDVVFANTSLLTRPLVAALHVQRASNSDFRAFRLGSTPESASLYPFDDGFNQIPSLADFQKQLGRHLPLPETIRILVVDDEPEVGEMFRDYFDHRTDPSFVVETASNGIEGEDCVKKNPPNVLILDIKMPERDGRELYRELKRLGILPPTIVFFDIVSADEILEIRRMGNPAFIEKGSHSSAMPEMASLIKKITYFG